MIANVRVCITGYVIPIPKYSELYTYFIESISREQFESLQKEVNLLQKELNYWQNTTINILKENLNGKYRFVLHTIQVEYTYIRCVSR